MTRWYTMPSRFRSALRFLFLWSTSGTSLSECCGYYNIACLFLHEGLSSKIDTYRAGLAPALGWCGATYSCIIETGIGSCTVLPLLPFVPTAGGVGRLLSAI